MNKLTIFFILIIVSCSIALSKKKSLLKKQEKQIESDGYPTFCDRFYEGITSIEIDDRQIEAHDKAKKCRGCHCCSDEWRHSEYCDYEYDNRICYSFYSTGCEDQ